MIAGKIASYAEQVLSGSPIDRSQADWLAGVGGGDLHDLFASADRLRRHFRGDKVRCCSIVAAEVGRCSQDCAFCSQSAHYETHVKNDGGLSGDDVTKAAREAIASGAVCFGIVNSGYSPSPGEIETWGRTVAELRAGGGVRVCASLGVLSATQAGQLAELGVERYNHNLQTSRRHFPNIVTTHSYDDRLATLRNVRSAGMSLCSGALFGMGETWEDRLDLAFELREIGADVVPINFLIPIEGTPLAGAEPLKAMECLKIIAVYRFLLPTCEIKIAGGRERNLRDLQSWMFRAGADSFLIGNYLTTCGRSAEEDRQMVSDLGLELESYSTSGSATAAGCDEHAGAPIMAHAVSIPSGSMRDAT